MRAWGLGNLLDNWFSGFLLLGPENVQLIIIIDVVSNSVRQFFFLESGILVHFIYTTMGDLYTSASSSLILVVMNMTGIINSDKHSESSYV